MTTNCHSFVCLLSVDDFILIFFSPGDCCFIYRHRRVQCSLVCSTEHLCVVVITLIIPAMAYYSSLERGSNLTCSESPFQPKTKEDFAFWNIWSADRLCGYTKRFLWDNKRQGCIFDWELQGSYFPLPLISLAWWALVRIQTYDNPGGLVAEICTPKRCQVPDSEQMLTNRNTNTPEGPSAYSSLRVGEGWGWQVLNCIEVEHAVMGISRFMTLVRKLTSQSCFLFCSYNVNGAPLCPSCNHPRPTNCTGSGFVSLYLSYSFSLFLSVFFLTSFFFLSLNFSLSLAVSFPALLPLV